MLGRIRRLLRSRWPLVAGAASGGLIVVGLWFAAAGNTPSVASGPDLEGTVAISLTPAASKAPPPPLDAVTPPVETTPASPPPSADPSAALAFGRLTGPEVPVRATVTYQIATRGEVTADLDGFAAEVASALRDPRGWRAAGIVFEAVESASDITIWLVEDGSVPSFSRACSVLYSCSVGRNIVVNQSRWLQGAPAGALDGVELSQYRVMVVNHEVGHWLGHHRHSACPGEGQIAPLMMQQSKGTDGCLFNPYPLDSELTAPDLFR